MLQKLKCKNVILIGVVSLLVACGGFTPRDSGSGGSDSDSAPENVHIDINSVVNAEPRNEEFSRYGNPDSYTVLGKTYHTLKSNQGFKQQGLASWYGTKFHGKRTSSGETYDMYHMTAAHKTLLLPSYVNVTNLDNGKQIVVKVNDRGPFHAGRIIDLSYVAALKLDIVENGTGRVEIEVIETASLAQIKGQPMFVQIGAYTDEQNALRIQSKLAASSIESHVHKVVLGAQKTVYRVRSGPFSQRAEADKLIESLTDLGVDGAKILHLSI